MKDARLKDIIFNEEKHTYFYRGTYLRGVTGVIGEFLRKNFPDTDAVKLAAAYGSSVHHQVEMWITKDFEPSLADAMWVKDYLTMQHADKIESELIVSDFIGTASKIDLVTHHKDKVILYDIKTTSTFDRKYCTLQLALYKRLYEANYGKQVCDMYVLGTKSRRAYHILDAKREIISQLLKRNAENRIFTDFDK